jgi:WD40 repeat protein
LADAAKILAKDRGQGSSDVAKLANDAENPVSDPISNSSVSETSESLQSRFKILGQDNGDDWFAIVNRNFPTRFNITLLHTFEQFELVSHTKFSADGKYLVMGGSMSTQVYDLESGKKIGTLVEECNIFPEQFLPGSRPPGAFIPLPSINSIPVCANGRYVATGWYDTVKIWDTEGGGIKVSLKGHKSTVICVEFSPDGLFLVSASHDGTIIYWDLERETQLFELSVEEGAPYSMSFSPDGKLFAAAQLSHDEDSGKLVILWNIAGELVARLETDRNSGFVAFSPSGIQLFAGSYGTPTLWELGSLKHENGGWQRKPIGLREREHWNAVGWTSEGPWAFSRYTYGCKVWDVVSGQPLFHLEVPSSPMSISSSVLILIVQSVMLSMHPLL